MSRPITSMRSLWLGWSNSSSDTKALSLLSLTIGSRFLSSLAFLLMFRYFLDNVAGWILEIEGGKMLPFEGNYSSWLLSKQNRLSLDKKREKVLKKHLQEELEWINKSPKGMPMQIFLFILMGRSSGQESCSNWQVRRVNETAKAARIRGMSSKIDALACLILSLVRLLFHLVSAWAVRRSH